MFDLTAMLNEMAAVASAIQPLLVAVGVTAGLILIGQAGLLMVKGRNGSQDDVPFGAVAGKLFIAACLMSFSRSISNTLELLGGAGSEVRSAVAYVTPAGGGTEVWSLALNVAFLWVAAIGAVGAFRGFLLWHEMANGENRNGGGDLFWRGLWHIVGGGVAINMGSA